MYKYKRMSYNKVLKDFGEIDFDIFATKIPKPTRGRPKKQKTIADTYIDVFGEFGAFDDALFGSFGGGYAPPPSNSVPTVPTSSVDITNTFIETNDDFNFLDAVFEGVVGEEMSVNQLIETASAIVDDFVSSGDYDMYDLGKVIISEPTNGNVFESNYVELKYLADDLILDFMEDDGNFYNKVWDTKEKMYVFVSKNFTIQVRIVKNPNMGYSSLKIKSVSDLRLKKSVVCINNTDDFCFWRCLAVAIAKEEKNPKLSDIVKGRKLQLTEALKIKDLIGCEYKGIETIKLVEQFLNCSISIVDTCNFLNISYPDIKSEDYEPKEWNIYLLKTDNHFDYINSNMIAGFFARKYYCNICKKSYDNKDTHKKDCIVVCKICCSSECDCAGYTDKDFKKLTFPHNGEEQKDKGMWGNCLDCSRWFPSQKCMEIHKKPKLCKITKMTKLTKSEHEIQVIDGVEYYNKPSVCDSVFKCQVCKKSYYDMEKFDRNTHKCGDYWCKNCDCLANTKTGHKCYMLPKPIKQPKTDYIFFDFECEQETKKHNVNYSQSQYFDSDENIEHFNIDDFCNWLFQDKHKGYSVIAHNGRGYDFQFVMEWIYKNTVWKPVVVYAGSKIMIMKIKELKMTFVDSLNFLTMPLSAFPKTFNIKELKKGFFPHYFNTKKNFNYVGKVPALKYFGYNSMKTKQRSELIKWWVAKRATNYKWDQFAEMKSYCISDVDILKKCCIKFRQQFLDVASIDPFMYTTIASVCMAIFRSDYIVDDFAENYPHEGTTQDKKDYMNQMRNIVMDEQKIAILPYEQQQFIRKAFFGGRTNATKLKYNFKGTEEGVYSDITSLYPSVNFYDEYPMGHPEDTTYKVKSVFTDDFYRVKDTGLLRHKSLDFFGDIKQYFGFIECDMECPKDLYFPVLPHKDGKLKFTLEDKRGVWATPEINKALDMGYKITRVYRVLHFKERTTKLFRGYVSKFLKIKQEASGFPEWVLNGPEETIEDRKQAYIKQYKDNQGIDLEYDKITIKKGKDGKYNLKEQQNAGLRAIAKLCLNSLWGKFGQRINMPKTEIIGVDKKSKYQEIMFNKTKYKNQDFHMIDENRMEIVYSLQDSHVQETTDTNIAIAAFTTSHARMRLYVGLEELGEQVLYHDTDSVVYLYDPKNPKHKIIKNGDYLGDWTDELDGVKMCGVFISGGPKNYSYETDDGEYHTKIKGFTLNYESTQKNKLNHNSMINLVDKHMCGEDTSIQVSYTMFNRNKKTKELKTFKLNKKYGFSYDKRHICPVDSYGNIDTLPFGHQDLQK